MTRSRRVAVAAGLMIAAASLSGSPAGAAPPRVVMVDDDGHAAFGDCGASRPAFDRIKTALQSSPPGARVLVCPGTYAKPIFGFKDRQTLQAATSTRPIIAVLPDRPVTIFQAWGVTIRGMTFQPDATGCSQAWALLKVDFWGSARVSDNHFRRALNSDGTCGTYGTAIWAGADSVEGLELYAYDNLITDYGGDAILASESGHGDRVVLVASRNRIALRADPSGTAPTAIYFDGSHARIVDNVISSQADRALASAIVSHPINPGGDMTIERNVIRGLQMGIDLTDVHVSIADNVMTGRPGATGFGIILGGTTGEVTRNVVTGFARRGISLEVAKRGPGGSTIQDNDFRGNGQTDCVDVTTGGGTAGTANVWEGNLGDESKPSGLCQASR